MDYHMHRNMWECTKALSWFYRRTPAFWQQDHSWAGFKWIDPHDSEQSVVSFVRRGKEPDDFVVVVVNFTPVVRHSYRIGVPEPGRYREGFNSDYEQWGGSGVANPLPIAAEEVPWHQEEQSIAITLPPLAAVFFRLEKGLPAGTTD